MYFFRGADCGIDYYLVVTKVGERLAVSKQAARRLVWKDLTSGSEVRWKLLNSIKLRIQTDLQLWRT